MRLYYVVFKNIFRLPRIIRNMRRLADRKPFQEKAAYEYLRKVIGIMQRSGRIRTEVYGKGNLPAEGGYIMYPNHQGKYDGYAVVSEHDKPCTVVMDDAKSHFLFIREVMDLVKGKRMQLDNPRQQLKIINEVAGEVEQGRKYIIFPEGGYTRNKKNTLTEFKSGCFKASVKSKTPVVPVVLVDTHKALNGTYFGPVKTQVHFLEPIPYEEFKGMKTGEVAALVCGRIQAKLDELTVM